MRYFLPDWEDRVHKEYNFKNEIPIYKNTKEKKYSYIWDIYSAKNVPIDGLLISRANLLTVNGNPNNRGCSFLDIGIREYYNFPSEMPLMCDCGAFSYIMEKVPPYDPIETLDFYAKCNFNFGVSVDHLIVPATYEQKHERYKITLENAKIMFNEWNSNKNYKNKLQLIGVVQGWDVNSYCKMTKELVEIGYDYIAIGGVARTSNKNIKPIISGVRLTINKILQDQKKQIDIHVFGVGRESLFRTYLENNITSFDSASFLRSAWLSDKRGYHLNFDYYTPIRIKTKRNIDREREVLTELQKFTKYKTSKVNTVMKLMMDNNDITEVIEREDDYKKTLGDKCWEKCDCDICKKLGIDVAIFRGNNRNRRRGFHNIWNYYNLKFNKFLPKISIVYSVSKLNDSYAINSLPLEIYEQIYDLPIEVFIEYNSKVFHIKETIDTERESNLISQLQRSKWVFSNKEIKNNSKFIHFSDSDNLREMILVKIKEIYENLLKPENLALLEKESNIQTRLEKYY